MKHRLRFYSIRQVCVPNCDCRVCESALGFCVLMYCLFLEFTIIHSKLWDAVSARYHYLGYMTVSPNQTLLVFQEA